MEKEEFPTFLNEQPKVVFGRTGREMLIIACGCVVAYSSWGPLDKLLHLPAGLGGLILHLLLAAIPIGLSCLVALVSVAERPMEEWFMVLAIYAFLPKLFLYMPLEDESRGGEARLQELSDKNKSTDDDENDSI